MLAFRILTGKTFLNKIQVLTKNTNMNIWVMVVAHPNIFWAYHFFEVKDWIV